MPRFELRYRPAALADLEDIFRGVLRVSASPVTARRYVARIVSPSSHMAVGRATTLPPVCAAYPSSGAR
jgi:plasmid stabilization system protein ParE